MPGFREFVNDAFWDRLDDPTLKAEFGDALFREDHAQLVNLANRSGYDASLSDSRLFFQELHSHAETKADKEAARKATRKAAMGRWKDRFRELFWAVVGAGLWLLVLGTLYGATKAISSIHFGILLPFAGRAFGLAAAVDLLIWGFWKASKRSGYSIDRSHEWRLVTRGGQPGASMGPATAEDVYDKNHGRGSWDRREKRKGTVCVVWAVLAVPVCALLQIPFLGRAGVQGFVPMLGYFVLYPLLPAALLGGLIAWANSTLLKTTPVR